MIKKQVTILNESGLHARPGSILVKEASKFESDIQIIKDGKEVNAKSMLTVLSLGVSKGQSLEIQVSGPDEKEAIDALVSLVEKKFGE